MAHIFAVVPARAAASATADLAREMAMHPDSFNIVDHYGSTLVVWRRPPLPNELVLIKISGRRRQAVCQRVSPGALTVRLGRTRSLEVRREDYLGVICERRKRFCGDTAA